MEAIPDSEGATIGASNFGLAAWSELSRQEERSSRIRVRDADGQIRILAELS